MSVQDRGWVAGGVLSRHDALEREPPAVASLDLDPGLLHLSRELGDLAPVADRNALFLLAAAVLAAERAGSTRVPLAEIEALVGQLAPVGASGASSAAGLLARAAAGDVSLASLFGGAGDYRPLLLAEGCLYSQRLWQLEQRVAARLRALLAAPAARGGAAVAEALADVRRRPALDSRGAPLALSEEQERAVLAALGGRVTVVTGGPGSGKTWIVAAILRVVARLGEPSLSAVALAAPTGKAADRLQTSIAAALSAVADPSPEDRSLIANLPAAVTLHRLLSYSPSGERFRHHERNPLTERLVLVDESSMLDLPLADHLLRSLPFEGSLVLLGDAQQLPSVEAGAVFRDLVEAAPAAPRVARLTRSWRMDAADPAGSSILTFAGRVAGGALGDLTEVVRRSPSAAALGLTGVELLEGGTGELARFLERWWSERVLALAGYLELRARLWDAEDGTLTGTESDALAPLMRHLESFRLLSPTRGWSGGTGVAALNAWFRSTLALAAGAPVEPGAEKLLAGEPVLVTRNDYARRLYNGDQGVALAVNVGGRPLAMAAFRRAEGGFRVVPIAALAGRLEPAWATTVHKAQGSEHDAVALVLPAEPGRLLTRELVYTAVTRARRSVVVVGSEAVLRAAVARSVERWSGIGEKLAPGPVAPPAARPGEQLGLPFD